MAPSSTASRVIAGDRLERVWLTPEDVRASEDALRAIAEAELIVLGPGSLFTSLLPGLLLPEIRAAVGASGPPRLRLQRRTQHGETAGYDLAAHVEALADTSLPASSTWCSPTARSASRPPSDYSAEPVRLRWPPRMSRAAPRARRRRRSGRPAPPRPGPARGGHPAASRSGGRVAPAIGRRADRVTEPLRARPGRVAPGRAGGDRPVAAVRSTRGGGGFGTRRPREGPVAASCPAEPRHRPQSCPGRMTAGARGGRRSDDPVRSIGSAADHCRMAWLRGLFLARGSLSLATGRTHLEFVLEPDEAPTLAERLDEDGTAGVAGASGAAGAS